MAATDVNIYPVSFLPLIFNLLRIIIINMAMHILDKVAMCAARCMKTGLVDRR